MEIFMTFPDNLTTPEPLTVEKKLSEGQFTVFRVSSSSRKTRYALKLFPRNKFGSAQYQKEKLMASFSHPNVIQRIPAIYYNKEFHGLLTEYARYGDFFDLVEQGVLNNELLIRTYFHQLIEGVEYIHAQGVAHLDLKLENLMMGSKFTLKIIDFDQAQKLTDDQLTSGGTVGYRAPEVLNGTCKNLAAVDVYCLGVILYAFQTKEFPFAERDDVEARDPLCYTTFVKNNKRFWRKRAEAKGDSLHFENDFMELVNGMLHPDPEKRWKIPEIKSSKWYQGPVLEPRRLRAEMKARWMDIVAAKATQ